MRGIFSFGRIFFRWNHGYRSSQKNLHRRSLLVILILKCGNELWGCCLLKRKNELEMSFFCILLLMGICYTLMLEIIPSDVGDITTENERQKDLMLILARWYR